MIFLDDQKTIHILVLLFQSYDGFTAALVLIKEFAKVFISVLIVLLHFFFDELTLIIKMGDSFFNQTLTSVQAVNLTSLSM